VLTRHHQEDFKLRKFQVLNPPGLRPLWVVRNPLALLII
jgi:hypothetical protein